MVHISAIGADTGSDSYYANSKGRVRSVHERRFQMLQ